MIQSSSITMVRWTTFIKNTKEKIKLYWVRGQQEGHIYIWKGKSDHFGKAFVNYTEEVEILW